MPEPAFATRMLYAPSAELVSDAARLGCNVVVAGSTGHKTSNPADDPPVTMPGYPKLGDRRERVEAHRAILRARFAQAKAAGMQVIYHTYEPSMPTGFLQAYPELYSPEMQVYRDAAGEVVARNRNLCVARAEVREAIAAKIAEICTAFPELDGLMYTNNESSSTTKVWHRCDHCAEIPYPQTMRFLHDALAEGIARAGRDIRLYYRCWGSHDHDFHYLDQYREKVALGIHELPGESWHTAYIDSFGPAERHFIPSRDNPRFAEYLRTVPTAVVYKASWADTNLHHPLNPWIGTYKPADESCELSFEFCRDAPKAFYVMGREMQRRARLCATKGVTGLVGVPLCWGMFEDTIEHCAHPSQWMLSELNLVLVARLMHNPETDLLADTRDYLAQRYGRPLPDELAALLLDSEDVAAEMMNINGVRASGNTLQTFLTSLFRYGPMRDDWRERLRPSADNLRQIAAAKQRAVDQAEAMLATIERCRPHLPARAAAEFRFCFEDLLASARACQRRQLQLMTAYGLISRDLDPSFPQVNQILRLAGGAANAE